jgi:hypothetical protein
MLVARARLLGLRIGWLPPSRWFVRRVVAHTLVAYDNTKTKTAAMTSETATAMSCSGSTTRRPPTVTGSRTRASLLIHAAVGAAADNAAMQRPAAASQRITVMRRSLGCSTRCAGAKTRAAIHSAPPNCRGSGVPLAPDVDKRGEPDVLEPRELGIRPTDVDKPAFHADLRVAATAQEAGEIVRKRRSCHLDPHRHPGERLGHRHSVARRRAGDTRRFAGPGTPHWGAGQGTGGRETRPRSRASLEASVRPFAPSLR